MAMFNDFDDDAWDEHQWEAHLNEKQTTQPAQVYRPRPAD
jgi:hypothetical protein